MAKFLSLIFLVLSVVHAEEIDLSIYEKSFYSQHGEDGVLCKLLEVFPPFPRHFIELGANDKFIGSNSHLLRLQGWNGLTLNRIYEDPKFGTFKEYITAENINELLATHKAQPGVYLLIIDMGYNDFYLWKALDEKYQPTLVMIQYNATYLPHEDKIAKYYPYYCGDGSDYFGASILALYHCGQSKGYSLVYADQSGSYLFFVKNEVLKTTDVRFKNCNAIEKIYRALNPGRYRKDLKERPYLSSTQLINP